MFRKENTLLISLFVLITLCRPISAAFIKSRNHTQASIEALGICVCLACEQALLFGQAKRASRELACPAPLSFAARLRVLARLVSLAQIGELARRLVFVASGLPGEVRSTPRVKSIRVFSLCFSLGPGHFFDSSRMLGCSLTQMRSHLGFC